MGGGEREEDGPGASCGPPASSLPTLGLGDQLHIKPETLTICFFVHSFIQQAFFSIYCVSGVVAGAQETDYPALGSPVSSKGQCVTGCHGGVTGNIEKGGGHCLGHQEGFPEEMELCPADGYGLYRQ